MISSILLCTVNTASCTVDDILSTETETGATLGETEVIVDETEATVGELKESDTIYIWTDEETGVQYVIYREKLYNAGFGGITPRLNQDGSLYIAPTTAEIE